MKTHSQGERGNILMMALLTIAILTMICATSLFVTSQDATSTTQTTSWQQAMAGAEAAVDQAMNALNRQALNDSSAWSTWSKVTSSSLPSVDPSPAASPTPAANPGSGSYNYWTGSLALAGEAGNSVSMWVTVDNGTISPTPPSGNSLSNGGKQAYRIRAQGSVIAPGPKRVSNNKLDNDLRKICLKYNRFTGTTVTNPTATRRIEVIAVPVATSADWPRGITLAGSISLSGSATVYSDIATTNSTGSDLRGQTVYGDVQYSGPAVKNTGSVQGTISTPFTATFTAPVKPIVSAWGTTDNVHQYTTSEKAALPVYASGNYTNYTGGGGLPKDSSNNTVSSFTASGPSTNPTLIKVTGDFTVSGGGGFSLVPNATGTNKYVVVWVTGKLTISGGSTITQSSNVYVTYIVEKDVTISGGSYNNQGSTAKNFEIVAVGNNKVTISSSSTFMGTLNAPGADVTVSGSGSFIGAVLANTLNISGSGTFSFDTTLGGSNSVANFAYASWFEDNSDPARGIYY